MALKVGWVENNLWHSTNFLWIIRRSRCCMLNRVKTLGVWNMIFAREGALPILCIICDNRRCLLYVHVMLFR